MIKNIIFDMGGVIVDVHRDRAIQNFKALGLSDADEFIDNYHHKGIFIAFENGDIDCDEFCRLLCQYTGNPVPNEAIENAWKSMIDPPFEYKLDYLQELRKSYQVFLLTNNNPYIINWACSQGFTSSGKALSDYFDKIYVSYKMKCTKPGLKIYQMMIEDAGINPAESLFVDDSEQNIQAASACGMAVHLVKNGSDWRNELSTLLKSFNL
jgi:putative hydrolase of the HAD superfamily